MKTKQTKSDGSLGKEKRVRKLEKAVAVSGVCAGVLEENSGKDLGKLLAIFPES